MPNIHAQPATAEIRSANGSDLATITEDQMTSLLNDILATRTTAFKAGIFNGINELQYEKGSVSLSVYGLDATTPSDILAGIVFDIYKIHADDTATNSIRAVQVENKVALCLSPVGADPVAVQNFFFGKEINGSMPLSGSQKCDIAEKRGGDLGIGCALTAVIPIIGWLVAGFCASF